MGQEKRVKIISITTTRDNPMTVPEATGKTASGAEDDPMEVDTPEWLYQLNDGWHLVDSLPYIDSLAGGIDMDAQIKHLIGMEMQDFEPRDYSNHFKPPTCEHLESGLLKGEMERIERGEPMEKLSLQRYELETPSGANKGDLNAWRAAVKNAKTQHAHFQLRMMNCELLSSWGVQMHTQNKLITQKFEQINDKEVNSLKTRLDSVNKRRKLDQVGWGNDIRNLQHEYDRRVIENGLSLIGIQEAKREIGRLKELCQDRAVLPDNWTEKLDSDAQRLLLA